MKASVRWLSEILGVDLDAQIVADRLTMSGVEIDAVRDTVVPPPGLVVARVVSRDPHPKRADLHVVAVDGGGGRPVQVVCGAPNTPGQGSSVVLARPGTVVRGRAMEARDIAGVPSHGMLCSEDEIGIGPDAAGIMVLDGDAAPGTPLSETTPFEDRILEYTVTPNRPDCLGHIGLAREIAAILGLPFARPTAVNVSPAGDLAAADLARIVIEDPAGCPRYDASVVTGVRVAPSPLAVRHRLFVLGVRPISNIVDVTNWMLLLHNQPLHSFDMKLLPGGTVIVRRASPGERIVTLDEIERILDPGDIVIASRDRAVAIAGVMGGKGSSIVPETTDVLIECAYFDAGSIRSTSSRLHLQTEASYRFERGTDPDPLPDIAAEAASMMARLGGGRMARGVLDQYPKPGTPRLISLRLSRVEKIVGAPFDAGWCKARLERLGCAVVESPAGALDATPPGHRPDLSREIDLIEELARLRGYDEIPSTLPSIGVSTPVRGTFDLVMRSKSALASCGLDEVVSLSFSRSSWVSRLGIPGEPVPVMNPIGSDRDVLRTSLVPGLLEQLAYHASRSRDGLRIFEVGTVFRQGQGGTVEGVLEWKEAAGLLWGPRPAWVSERRGDADFHDAWGAASNAIRIIWSASPEVQRYEDDDVPRWLHPRSACRILASGREVGWVGELHPVLGRDLDLPSARGGEPPAIGLFAFEVSEEPLTSPRHRGHSDMPAVERDLALVFPESTETGSILAVVGEEAGHLLEETRVFDVFRGGRLGAGLKSVAFRIQLRAASRTLTQDEVEAIVSRIVTKLESRLGGKLR